MERNTTQLEVDTNNRNNNQNTPEPASETENSWEEPSEEYIPWNQITNYFKEEKIKTAMRNLNEFCKLL